MGVIQCSSQYNHVQSCRMSTQRWRPGLKTGKTNPARTCIILNMKIFYCCLCLTLESLSRNVSQPTEVHVHDHEDGDLVV